MTAGLIYIHGFISSPQSLKAQLLGHYVAEHHSDIHYMVPSLSNTPAEAFRELDQLVQDYLQNNTGPLGLVGSSMAARDSSANRRPAAVQYRRGLAARNFSSCRRAGLFMLSSSGRRAAGAWRKLAAGRGPG